MSGEVIVFRPPAAIADNDDGPHLAGLAICSACRHEWSAVAPVGVVHLECPSCKRPWGTFKNAIEPEEAWVCNCGEHLFFVTQSGLLCRKCGSYQTGAF